MVEYKDIWSDMVLIIALLISVFAFSGYSPDVASPTLLAPQTELIFSPDQETQVKPISSVLNLPEQTTPLYTYPFVAEAMRIQATLVQVSFAQLSVARLEWCAAHRFPFLLTLRPPADEVADFSSLKL